MGKFGSRKQLSFDRWSFVEGPVAELIMFSFFLKNDVFVLPDLPSNTEVPMSTLVLMCKEY